MNFRSFILLSAFTAAFNSCTFTEKKAQRLYDHAKDQVYDMVIVPGIPLQDTGWDRIMKGRIYWSKFLYDKGIARNIMYSGGAVYTPYYEGMVMAMYAEAIGIPREHIYFETEAEHSTENLYYSYYKAKKMGFTKIALATDPFQSKQLKSFARKKLDTKVDVIPFVTDTMMTLHAVMTDPVIEKDKAIKKGFVSIKERESFWKRLKGTMGWNIDKKKYK